jgi:Cys-tRNA(Pro)/Cys-tRNA(Cys) deacylase
MSAKSPATPATVALAKAGIAFVPHAYDHDAGTTDFGVEAATKLGLDPARVFKTLVVDTDAGLVVGIVPVNGMLDVKALAGAVGAKRGAMADKALAEKKTGYVLGGISPIGQRTRLSTVLDAGALDHDTIFVSGGRRGFDIELAPRDLLAVTGGIAAVIRRADGD